MESRIRPHRSPIRTSACALVALVALALASPSQASVEDIQAKYQESAEAMRAGDYAKAAALSGEALAMSEKEFGKDHPQTGILAYNTGALYVTAKNWAQARPVLETALASYSAAHGESSPKLIPVIDKLVETYRALAQLEPASEVLERKLAIVEKVSGEESKEAADALRDVAATNGLRGRYKLSRRQLRKAMRIYEGTVGKESAEMGQATMALGMNELFDPELGASKLDAGRRIKEGVEILEKAYPPGSQELIQLYTFLERTNRAFPLPESQKEADEYKAKLEEQKKIAAEAEAKGGE